jgi:hypothetical protein
MDVIESQMINISHVDLFLLEAAIEVDMLVSGEVSQTDRTDVMDDVRFEFIQKICSFSGLPTLAQSLSLAREMRFARRSIKLSEKLESYVFNSDGVSSAVNKNR